MTTKYVFQQSQIPKLDSPFGQRMANDLWNKFLWFSDSRRDQEEIVRECDEAYLCHRYVPDTGAIELIEDGEFGESDLHDISNLISIRLALAQMPRNEDWLTVSSQEGEADDKVQAIAAQQMFLHRKARSRRQMQRIYKQEIVRGSTYGFYDWEDHYRYRRATPAENAREITKFLRSQGMRPEDARKFTVARGKELTFSGPVLTPVDFYDVWVNPRTDIIVSRTPAYILRRFKFVSELKDQVDENDKPVYKNLKDLEPYTLEEIETSTELGGGRIGSVRLFGQGRRAHQSHVKMVPVYMFYLPYYEFEGYKFYDTYFHLAISRKGPRARLILIEENQNDLGLNHLLMDHYIDFYTQTPYGISGIQYQVPKLRQKDFLQLLTVTGAAHSIFGPSLVYEAAFRDEDEISYRAGDFNYVLENPLGLDVIKPIEMPQRGVQLGEQALRFWAEEIKAGSGVEGLSTDSGARTLSKPKTATEVSRDVSSGSFFLDNQAENGLDLLTEYVQGVWLLTQKNIKPSAENPNVIEYQKYLGDKVIDSFLSIQDLNVKRSVQVTGISGKLKGQQDVDNMLKLFEVAGQVPDPRMTPIKMFLAQRMSQKLDVKIPEEFMASPEELVATNPEVQMLALQNALQNPEIMQQVAQMLAPHLQPQGGSPNGGVAQAQPINQPQ